MSASFAVEATNNEDASLESHQRVSGYHRKVTLIIGGRRVQLSRILLRSRSKYFRRLFRSQFADSNSDEIELHDDDTEAAYWVFTNVDLTGNVQAGCGLTRPFIRSLLRAGDLKQLLAIWTIYDKYQFIAWQQQLIVDVMLLSSRYTAPIQADRETVSSTALEFFAELLPVHFRPFYDCYATVIVYDESLCCARFQVRIEALLDAHPEIINSLRKAERKFMKRRRQKILRVFSSLPMNGVEKVIDRDDHGSGEEDTDHGSDEEDIDLQIEAMMLRRSNREDRKRDKRWALTVRDFEARRGNL